MIGLALLERPLCDVPIPIMPIDLMKYKTWTMQRMMMTYMKMIPIMSISMIDEE
jgi:hypothetical protein